MITLLIGALALHLAYYLLIFARLISWRIKSEDDKSDIRPLSILVCIKNEKSYIPNLIDMLDRQAAAEVVVVDDYSTDGSYDLLQELASDRIRTIQSTQDRPGKKQANADGIAATTVDRILMTDADCTPASDDWSRIMAASHHDIVLGYSPMKKTFSLVNLFSRYETYMTGVQYLSYAAVGMPYMGVGRNLLINKQILKDRSTTIKGQHLASGDDDLTVNAVATAENTTICIEPKAYVYTESVETWKAFVRQKIRHISTASYYKVHHQLLLGAFSASQITFYLLWAIGLLLGTIPLSIGISLFVIKQIVQIGVHGLIIRKMKETIALHQLLFLDLMLFGYYLIMPLLILTHKKDNHWN